MMDPGPNRAGPNPLLVGEMARAREVEHAQERARAGVARGRWPSSWRLVQVVLLVLGALAAGGWILTLLNAH